MFQVEESDRRFLSHASDSQVSQASLISSAPISGIRPPWFTKKGQHAAERHVGKAIRTLPEHKDQSIRAAQVVAVSNYKKLISTAMNLSPMALLGDSSAGRNYAIEPYTPEDHPDMAICHTVFLPFAPGGYMYIYFSLMFWEEAPDVWFDRPYLGYFSSDSSGEEADELYNEDRNDACAATITHHLRNGLFGVWSGSK